MTPRLLVFGAFLLACLGCFIGSPTSGDPPPPSTATLTYYKDVAPIFQQHCQGCHITGGIAPFPLLTFDDARANGPAIVSATGSRTMPPWGARTTTECVSRAGWKEDPSLSDAQISTLASWVSQGMAAGNTADAPPPLTPLPPGLANVQSDLAPPQGYTLPSGANNDEFQCFVLDPQVKTTSYIDATDVIPGNPLIVHHAVIFADPQRASLALITNQQQQSYSCFAGPSIASSGVVAAWVPGSLPQQFPAGIAMPITPGTLLVMQVHYHPHTIDPRNQNPDTTHLQLHYAAAAPQYQAINKLIGNFTAPPQLQPGPTFEIPANSSNVTETMVYTVPTGLTNGRPASVYSVGGHMHLVGSDIKLTVERASPSQSNPAEECLLQIPQWNFDWQRQYAYDIADPTALPGVSSGDTLKVRCTYDNTMNNTQLASELAVQGETQTHAVALGETTLDEMCLAIVTLVVAK